MNAPSQIAKHLREAYFGGNWTESSLKDHVADLTWQQAVKKIGIYNTIAALVYHMGFYVNAQLNVLRGNELNSQDKNSFAHPEINSEDDWHTLLNNLWAEVESLASLIEKLPEDRLFETFVSEKYGSYFRNHLGLIEHSYYHLGQIVILKKML